jgi:hypothetical protein
LLGSIEPFSVDLFGAEVSEKYVYVCLSIVRILYGF